jgi:RecB family endonuclease NucS
MRTGSIETPPSTCSGTFGLERHLHFFLRENWHLTELGRDWSLVEDDEGNVDGAGSERITPIGRIDLLAKHRTEPRWLVVELKRWQADDQTVAQLLRYMGWVKTDLATVDEQVEGLIIASEETNRLQYALKPVPSASFMRYEVDFRLVRGR